MEVSDSQSKKMSDVKAVTSPVKQERVEIDTSLPFESVREAVSLFGERVDLRKPKFNEKKAAKDAEVLHAQEELLNIKEQVANLEKNKEKLLYELAEARKSLALITEMPNASDEIVRQGSGVDVQNVDKMEQGPNIEEKHVVWETQLRVTKDKHTAALAELEHARQEVMKLKQEFLVALREKDSLSEQTGVALAAAADNTKRAEDLVTEIAGINESLVLLKLACIEANKDKMALLEAKQVGSKESTIGDGSGTEISNQESVNLNELKRNLAAKENELEGLQAELRSAKEDDVKAASFTRDGHENLEALRLELERTRMSEESAAASLRSLSTELEEAKATLKQELDSEASLSAMLEALQMESEMMKKELTGLKEREANATSAATVLTGELTRIREELTAATAAEAKAVESISGLSQAFEQVEAEAAEAMAEAEALQEVACGARRDAEQAKVETQNAETMLQRALQEADAAKAAEAAAVDRVKSLSVKTYAARASEVDSGAGITISQDEYESLKRKVQEAEDLANMRVAAAMAQVEAVRASEQEILRKLAMATEDMENTKAAMKQALQRAEMADAAKSAVEGELKRLREREQRKKEKEMSISSQQYFTRNGDEHSQSLTQQIKPLGNVQDLNMASEQASRTMNRTSTQKQKKPFLNSLGSYLSKRRGSSKIS